MKQIALIVILAAIAAVVPLFMGENPYFTGILISVLMMAALSSAWNLLGGYAGQYSFGHAAYFGAGAYTTMILITLYNLNPVLCMAAGMVVACIIALITGSIVFRLRGHYFALASIAVAEIVRLSVLNFEFTGGAQGILLSDLSLWGLDLNSKNPFYYGMLLVLVVSLGITAYLRKSKTGFYLQAIREDQDAAASLGINLSFYKNKALLISAALTSVLGSLYGLYIRFIDTSAVLDLRLSIEIILTAIIGGVGTLWGPVIGAVLLVPLAEMLRSNFIGDALVKAGLVSETSGMGLFLKENLAHAHVLVYGIITVLCILYLPKGILGLFRRVK
ncbi:branched-chain amino acid ABC transporter permease [Pelodictyon phaeoclathratiforme]|uniref:Inner-membrane translocator n=1 Tax=Pelodictyon phaeoclathratiforme (strain DSM 5477 / BU-1) TaxID=324925 RepID=B4SBK5_PELPB|nr:branched-chain amino acid ABC transporter permease [Pelodictyon phaeoclathratiforme]ACF44059.1 inner-membrane translocator [Pelodictyon phaeoclathratiforme BU-1]